MSEQMKQPNSKQPIQPEGQPPQPPAQPKTTWRKNSLKNLLYLASLLGLVSLLFWLVLPTNQPATLAQVTPVGTAFEFPITQTITPQVTPTQMPEPTATPTTDYSHLPFPMPSPVSTDFMGNPIYVLPGYIGPTYTPTPIVTPSPTIIPAVRLVSDEPLLSPELITTMGIGNVQIVAWPSEDMVILESGYSPATYWQYSMSQQTITPTTYTYPQIDQTIIDEFQQYSPPVGQGSHLELSPDNQWGIWERGDTVILKQIGAGHSPIEVIKLEYGGIVGFGREPWSRQSDRFLFVILNGDSYRYEIRISDLTGKIITTIPLIRDFPPASTVWSPDGQYLAFEMRDWESPDIKNVYAIKSDGNGLGQLTQHGLVNGNILWSPSGKAIIYSHEGDKKPWIATLTLEGGK